MESKVLSREASNVHRVITDKIIAAIEKGAGAVEMPWHRLGATLGRPQNAATGNGYPSGSVSMLSMGWY